MNNTNEQLDKLTIAVLASTKYRSISTELIRGIGSQELVRRHTFKEALKATKNKLHQVGGAYLEGKETYTVWLNELEQASQAGVDEDFLRISKKIMSHHASTRERLPLLDQFYSTILADLPPIHSVLDLACGFNPLTRPWMPLPASVEYYACDIYQDTIDFLNKVQELRHVQGHAWVCNLIQSCPTNQVDIAFILKTIPCLEQVDKSAGYRLLHTVNADHMVVSFPVHSLGGGKKGMLENYESRFRELVADTNWSIKRYEFSTELVYVITK